jgi:hypothetical protein
MCYADSARQQAFRALRGNVGARPLVVYGPAQRCIATRYDKFAAKRLAFRVGTIRICLRAYESAP